MTEIIISVNIPSIGEKHDFIIPIDIQIYELIDVIMDLTESVSKVKIRISQPILCNSLNGEVYEGSDFIYETPINGGSELVLL